MIPGMMKCLCDGCNGNIEMSGQEVTRFICSRCGQNYQLRVLLEPVSSKSEVHKQETENHSISLVDCVG
jgi:DNA-directed RNA polymerase subunit M/transcription elongation factor TFIIS